MLAGNMQKIIEIILIFIADLIICLHHFIAVSVVEIDVV